jgi:16S rRNA (guanine527-N7)-methyltransferase
MVDFESELNRVLPADLPHRENVVRKSAQHLGLIAEANRYLNLTRIATPREAATKHVLDSIVPWRLFEGAKHVLDAGTGAGFPGVPLALALPEIHFTLAESVQKKARFVESALAAINLPNVSVSPQRAEDLLKTEAIDMITARAFAPLSRTLDLLGPSLKRGARALLYKGPDVEREIAGADRELKKLRASVRVVMRYDLPDSLGARAIVEIVC